LEVKHVQCITGCVKVFQKRSMWQGAAAQRECKPPGRTSPAANPIPLTQNASPLQHIKAIITSEEVLLRNGNEEAMVPIVEEFKRRLTVSGIGSDYDSDTNRANASPQAGLGHERAPPDDADCECAPPDLSCAAWLNESAILDNVAHHGGVYSTKYRAASIHNNRVVR
jgi:hypothetical protein